MTIQHPVPTKEQRGNLLKELWHSVRRKNPATTNKRDESIFHEHRKITRDTIYDDANTITLAQHANRFHQFHYIIKYKLYVPLLLILERQVEKYLKTTIPDKTYNRELQVFNDAWEAALEDWSVYYLAPQDPQFKQHPAETMQRYQQSDGKTGFSSRQLRTIKGLLVTYALEDTAGREFLNMFVHQLAQHYAVTHEQYKHRFVHPLYVSGNLASPGYFIIWEKIKNGELELEMEDLDRVRAENQTSKPEGL